MYIKTDSKNKIIAIATEPQEGFRGIEEDDNLSLAAFLVQVQQQDDLLYSDIQLVRVLEDLIQVLIQNGALRFTDLPIAAQDKLNRRKILRDSINDLNLIDDDQGLI